MKHVYKISMTKELPRKAGIEVPRELCDELRKVSNTLAREAGCPPTKKELVGLD